jgi:N6-adenosine-specific RNA methylase IME4
MMAPPPFETLCAHHYGAILADAAWRFETWSERGRDRSPDRHYRTLPTEEIMALPVASLAAPDCVLFLWATWPMILHAFQVITAWGFTYKTCAFNWTKADASQIELFQDDIDDPFGETGYWTRANTEPCLLATRGHPKRINADVRQAIIEPRREHSRKPDCVYERIERLIAGPYVELFARQRRAARHNWGNELDKFPSGGATAQKLPCGRGPQRWRPTMAKLSAKTTRTIAADKRTGVDRFAAWRHAFDALRGSPPSSLKQFTASLRANGDIRAALRRARAARRPAWRPPVLHPCPASTPRRRERGACVVAESGRDGSGERDDGGGDSDDGEGGGSDPPPPRSRGVHVLERGRQQP